MGSLAEFDSSVYRELTGGWESNVVGYLDFSDYALVLYRCPRM